MGAHSRPRKRPERFTEQRINPSFSAMGLIAHEREQSVSRIPRRVHDYRVGNSAANLRSMLYVLLNDEISDGWRTARVRATHVTLSPERKISQKKRLVFYSRDKAIANPQKYLAGDQREYRVPYPWCELHAWK